MVMKIDSVDSFQYSSILTLVGRDLQICEQTLEVIATSLAEKFIDILVVYTQQNEAARKGRISTFITRPYDTVFLDDELAESDERRNIILSRYYLNYDLIILCRVERDCPEEIEIFEGKTPKGEAHFRLNAGDEAVTLAVDLYDWLLKQLSAVPVWGCVLIGGKSSRMGRPKHLIKDADGITWGDRIVRTLSEVTERVILSGRGEIPPSLTHLERLVDISGAQGPLAGILAAMRWNPHVSYIVAACDMPGIRQESLQWMLGRRRPGVWGTVPLHLQTQRLEPLLAYYDYRSRNLFEHLLQTGSLRPNHVCKSMKIETPEVPSTIADSWYNCNTPEDLSVVQGKTLDTSR